MRITSDLMTLRSLRQALLATALIFAFAACSRPEHPAKQPASTAGEAGISPTSRFSTGQRKINITASAASIFSDPMRSSSADSPAFGFDGPYFYPLLNPDGIYTSPIDSTAIGDVTGDERDDIVVLTLGWWNRPYDRKLFVFVQDESGALRPPMIMPFTDGLYPRVDNYLYSSISLADMNNDNVKEIVIGYGKGIGIFSYQRNGGFSVSKHLISPEYIPESPVFDSYSVRFVVSTDIDADGNLDIVAHNGNEGATLFYGDGYGHIRQTVGVATPFGGISDVRTGDLTGDGIEDIVVLAGERYARKYWILPNRRAPGFGPARIFSLPDDETYKSIAVGDWTGDGQNEIAITVFKNIQVYGLPAGLQVFKQTTPGQFSSATTIPTYHLPLAMVSRDIDRDGLADLVVEHTGWNATSIFLQTEHDIASPSTHDGTPCYQCVSSTNYNPQAMSLGDIDNDGCTDMVLGDINYGLAVNYGVNCKHKPWPRKPPVLPADPVDTQPVAIMLPATPPDDARAGSRIGLRNGRSRILRQETSTRSF